ncbi:AAA family ATPase [Nocardioides sp. URHA0020]|uniref:AAA family ATPase n=1 Tax=Nocardioides sp. URHA0020 TaxID=1380392 RepID=UPI0018CC5DCE|nr:AAA family ATPase [Nocardioides sp. URHA0020]
MGQPVGILHVLVGLPGSGKSTYLNEHFKVEHPDVLVLDDYQADAILGRPDPEWSRNRPAAIEALRNGQSVLISDVAYCRARALSRIISLMRADVPALDVNVIYFANDPASAEHNVRLRGREGLARELELIADLAKDYPAPEHAMPITRGTPLQDGTA